MDEQLKAKFKAIIDYQRKDIELRKINLTIEKDEALASMNANKRAFNEAKQALSDCESEAAVQLENYAELQKYIADIEATFADIDGVEVEGEEEIAQRFRKLESLRAKFGSAEKKLHDIEDKSKSVCAKRADALKSGKSAKQKHEEARARHEKLVSSKAGEVNKLKAELAEMQKSLDPKLLEEYKKLAAENKFPPFVPAAGDEKKNQYNCGGCGLNLPQKGNAMLKDQGYFRCENCRRIIVKLN